MVSFSEVLEGFSLRLRVEAAPSVPRTRRPRAEVGSGADTEASMEFGKVN